MARGYFLQITRTGKLAQICRTAFCFGCHHFTAALRRSAIRMFLKLASIHFFFPCKKENSVPCPPAAAPLTANTALVRNGSSSSDDSARKALCFFKLGAAASARARAAAAASCASAIAATNERVGGVVLVNTWLAHALPAREMGASLSLLLAASWPPSSSTPRRGRFSKLAL